MRVLQAKTKRPLDVLAAGAGGHVAAASSAFEATGHVDVWAVATGAVVFTHAGGRGNRQSLAFAPDGESLFVGGEEAVEVFDTRSWKPKPGPDFDTTYPQIAVSPAGNRLIVTGLRGATGQVACWELRSGQKPVGKKLWEDESFGDILFGDPAVAPGGTSCAVSLHFMTGDHSHNGIHIGDMRTGESRAEVEFDRDGSDPIRQVAFSADGSKVLVRASGRTVKLYDTATGQPAGELVHTGRPYVTGMAVHPGGTVACSRNNGRVCLWNLAKGELVRELDWKLGKLVSIAFAPDGSIGAAGTEDGQVVVWDVDE